MSGARQAAAFLTPIGGSLAPTPAALAWFPVVGLALGSLLGGLWWGADQLWPPLLAATLVVGADLGLTGMLHADGLADSADGLLPHLEPDRRLAVMSAPDVGAFGATVLGVTLLVRVGALAAIAPAPLLLAGLWCASRSLMAAVATRVHYARPSGLASAFLGGRNVLPFAGLAVAVAVAAGWRPVAGITAVLGGLLAGAGVVALAVRRVGGFTGDVLGAAGLVLESVGLVIAAARW
jgi:adenosylcobinamide-GDP ribazoletransferase